MRGGDYYLITLKLDVIGQKLIRQDNEMIIDKSQGIINCQFKFHNNEHISWEGIDKFAIFTNIYNDRNYVRLGKGLNCTCTIPSEAMVGRIMNVTVYGGEHITTNQVSFILTPSHYKHIKPKPTTSKCGNDIFTDIYKHLGTKIEDIEVINQKLLLYKDNEIVRMVDLADALLSDYYTRDYINAVLATKYDDFNITEGFIICSSEGEELKRIPLSIVDEYYYNKQDIDNLLEDVNNRIDDCFNNVTYEGDEDGVYLILEHSKQE